MKPHHHGGFLHITTRNTQQPTAGSYVTAKLVGSCPRAPRFNSWAWPSPPPSCRMTPHTAHWPNLTLTTTTTNPLIYRFRIRTWEYE